MNQMPHLSIIIPVYNAESFLLQSLNELGAFMSSLACSAELIIVDDGSSDGSFDMAKSWAGSHADHNVRVLRLGTNEGKGAAVAAGMLSATGLYRIFLDVDLAYPTSQILRILEMLEEGCDVAVANRVHPESRYTISPSFFRYLFTRHLASRVINWLIRHTLIPNCSDSQAGLKGFSAEAAIAIFSRQKIKGFPFDVEALFLANKMGFRVREVAVDFQYFNEPTTVAFMQDGIGMLSDIMSIRLNALKGQYNIHTAGRRRRLIINADDFGMTIPISRGILKTNSAGAVRATSIMANSPDFDASMDEIMSAGVKPDVGFHATLTWGMPVSDPSKIPTLVDRNGKFFTKGKLLLRALLRIISEEDVYRELRAQCEKIARRWPLISHMDGHHHVHAFPVISAAATRVAREFKIKIMRAPYEGLWSPWYSAQLRRMTVALLPASRPSYWLARGFVCADHFGGFSLDAGGNLMNKWNKILEALPNGTTEIMVHPGFESINCDSYNLGRKKEVEVLSDPDFVHKVENMEIKLISFAGLKLKGEGKNARA